METRPALHIFNPEHDYALAGGRRLYTPPASIAAFRRSMGIISARWARPGDAILLPDPYTAEETEAFRSNADVKRKGLTVITPGGVTDLSPFCPAPWGWDHSIRATLLRAGVAEEAVPTLKEIDRIGELSHRRTTIGFCTILNETEAGKRHPQELPVELHDEEEAMLWLAGHRDGFLKAPWSSSGRGVADASTLGDLKLRQWVRGVIRRQGSVIGEVRFPKTLDLATEWRCSGGTATLIGYSIFHTTVSGRYLGNDTVPADGFDSKLRQLVPQLTPEVTDAQKYALESLIAPDYNGLLGIDMMAGTDGRLRMCVELNLRMTMGHVELLKC